MTWTLISKIKIFVHGIFFSYLFELSDKYFEMSCPMDISTTNIYIRDILGIPSFHSATGPCRLQLLRTRVATAFFAPQFITVMRSSSVAASERPPRRGLPSTNPHNHVFTVTS